MSVTKKIYFGYFETILAKKQILAFRGYRGHILAYNGGQLPSKLKSPNEKLWFVYNKKLNQKNFF